MKSRLVSSLIVSLLFPASGSLFAQTVSGTTAEPVVVRRIQVVDETGRGIQAELRAMDPSDKDTHFAYTDEKGVVEPNKRCDASARLLPKPRVEIYQPLRRLPYCQPDVKIALKLAAVKVALFKSADEAFAKGEFAVATMLYTESAWRSVQAGDSNASKAERNAYKALEKAFGGDATFVLHDPKQDKPVLTQEAIRFLETYQKTNKLPVSRKLDIMTTQHMANTQIFPFIKDAYRTGQ
ncbi:MAG: hypothetical protein AB7O31_05520 [Burkholderiales bacterium]